MLLHNRRIYLKSILAFPEELSFFICVLPGLKVAFPVIFTSPRVLARD